MAASLPGLPRSKCYVMQVQCIKCLSVCDKCVCGYNYGVLTYISWSTLVSQASRIFPNAHAHEEKYGETRSTPEQNERH